MSKWLSTRNTKKISVDKGVYGFRVLILEPNMESKHVYISGGIDKTNMFDSGTDDEFSKFFTEMVNDIKNIPMNREQRRQNKKYEKKMLKEYKKANIVKTEKFENPDSTREDILKEADDNLKRAINVQNKGVK